MVVSHQIQQMRQRHPCSTPRGGGVRQEEQMRLVTDPRHIPEALLPGNIP